MKSYMVFVVVILACVSGCAANPHPHDVNFPNGEAKEVAPCTKQNGCDRYDVAGDYVGSAVAIGSRDAVAVGVWTWNAGKGIYEWATSPAVEAKVSGVLDSVKNAAGSVSDTAGHYYDQATEAYHNYQATHPSKEDSIK